MRKRDNEVIAQVGVPDDSPCFASCRCDPAALPAAESCPRSDSWADTETELPSECRFLPITAGRASHRAGWRGSKFERAHLHLSPRQASANGIRFLGKFLPSIANDLFVTAHMLRVDPEDNIWTTDIGSHVVLKISPDGRVLLALVRMRIPGDDVLHFNQPTDVALDRDGNIYVADGYGNSRVLKFDRYGNPLLGWGMKGTGPGQFDTPHTIVGNAFGELIKGIPTDPSSAIHSIARRHV